MRRQVHGVGATDCLRTRFREAERLNLAFLDKFLHRPSYIFDRNVEIDARLMEEMCPFPIFVFASCFSKVGPTTRKGPKSPTQKE